MKKVTSKQFIEICKELVKKMKDGSATKSVCGEFFTVTYLVSSVLRNSYYAKNQTDKSDKNPYWGRDIIAIKVYNPQCAISYGTQREKDGYTLNNDDEDKDSPFKSIVKDLIFQHKESGRLYIQVMSKAIQSTLYLDGNIMSDTDKEILNRYKKPYKDSGKKSDDYKKLCLDKIVNIKLNGECYEIDNTTYINVNKEEECYAN